MPSRRISKPPEAMTWTKATPVLAVAIVFDILRFISEQFWFFGPSFAAVYCTAKAAAVVGGGATAVKVAGMFCGSAAAAAGSLGSPLFATFGIILAMALGLMGWLTIVLWILGTNARLFEENILWFGGSLILSEVPILGSLPALTATVLRMYRTQIKNDEKTLKKYHSENAAAEIQERQQRAAEMRQFQEVPANAAQQQEVMEMEEGGEEGEESTGTPASVLRFPSERAGKTSRGKNIPDELRKAA
ncbi:MAG: hypothetical protein NT108_02010 [Candidatus Kaiserbacteria bacterium]|nr:hypothetical protein [Candidatus Kaiserbacteria bacterium]